jgi:hypothetical protein
MDNKLKRLLIYYGVSAVGATILISGAILSDHYIGNLSNTLQQFQTLKINNIKMKSAVKEMEATSLKVEAMIPPNYKVDEMEGAILATLDSIKKRMKTVDVLVADFDRKENETVLPVTLTGTIGDYAQFVNDMGHLQALTSPFMFIQSVAISKSLEGKKEVLHFDIKGALKIRSRSTDNKI